MLMCLPVCACVCVCFVLFFILHCSTEYDIFNSYEYEGKKTFASVLYIKSPAQCTLSVFTYLDVLVYDVYVCIMFRTALCL